MGRDVGTSDHVVPPLRPELGPSMTWFVSVNGASIVGPFLNEQDANTYARALATGSDPHVGVAWEMDEGDGNE